MTSGNAQENSLTEFSFLQEMMIDHWNHIYVADGCYDQVMPWCIEDKEKKEFVIAGNRAGEKFDQFNSPNSLLFN